MSTISRILGLVLKYFDVQRKPSSAGGGMHGCRTQPAWGTLDKLVQRDTRDAMRTNVNIYQTCDTESYLQQAWIYARAAYFPTARIAAAGLAAWVTARIADQGTAWRWTV